MQVNTHTKTHARQRRALTCVVYIRIGNFRVRCWFGKENFSAFSSTCNFNSLTRHFVNAPHPIYIVPIYLYISIGCADFFLSQIHERKKKLFDFIFIISNRFFLPTTPPTIIERRKETSKKIRRSE